MEVTKAEIDAVLDAQGRFVWTPNALTLDGQRNVPCDLQVGESLDAFLRRHVPGIDSGAWSVSIGGAMVPRAMWAKTFPKHGMLIACRATVGKQAVQLVAIAALAYFSGGLAAGLYGAIGGTYVAANAGLVLSALQMGIFVAGSVLINKVLGPKVPKAGDAPAARQVYSLSGQRNSARAYEPVPVLFGEMRVTPDLAAQSYVWNQGDDQFMAVRLLGGVNVHSVADLAIGETALSEYHSVNTYLRDFSGHDQQEIPLAGNVDTIPGGLLPDAPNDPVVRTTSTGTVAIGVDIEYTTFHQGDKGIEYASVEIVVGYRAVGASGWTEVHRKLHGSSDTSVRRLSLQFDVPEGQYDVFVQRSPKGGDEKTTRQATWNTLRCIQPDTTNYSGLGCIGIKIKATGQLSGALDTVRATYRAKPMPIWNGTAWATATARDNGLSNPGAILLQALRGIWHNGKLQFGFGLSDDQIDIDGLKAFMLHCTAKGYTYDKWITSSMSLQEFCQEVALAGMGEFSWTDGSRPTVVFVSAGQPVSAVVNMANMLKASFSVDYALSNAADGIEYQYVDRTKKFETVTLRVSAPGVATPLNPARIKGEGVTSEAHAAVMARYHLAQSLYQYKTIGFGADIEHLDYRRLSLLSVSHDLTQWGFGGRLEGISVGNGYIQVQLGESVPALSTPRLGLRLPGGRDYRVWPVQEFTGESDTLILLGDWPEGVRVPGSAGDDPVHDTLWCYDFKATPGYRVRVTGIEPEGDLKGAKVTCVPEGPEFWDYVLNGVYVPAPAQSSLPELARSAVKNLRVSERVNVQGDTEWYELGALWEADGDYDHAQVWASRDGEELRLVDANAVGMRSTWRIDGPGEYLVEVRPFSRSGRVGTPATVLYITTMTARAPRNVDDFVVQALPGGLRRFAWQYVGDKPPTLAGVQIRYVSGDVLLSTDMWSDMAPLGQADDIYKAQFETTRPEAGLWTFGIRAIDTTGQLSSGVRRFVANLDDSFEQVQQPDLTPPPAPTGVAAMGMFATVKVGWDAPIYETGHGHARTEVWVSEAADFAESFKAAEGYSGPVSFEWKLGSAVYVRARHVTNDGVTGPWSAVASAQTAEDVGQLLDVLDGQITESQLYTDLSKRIDAIDVGSPKLGKSLLESAASLETTQQQVRHSIDDMAQGLLEAALAADAALERITDAGVYVEPGTGQVKIYGLEVTKENVTNLEVLLDAVAGQLSLKATTAYVDGKIADAVLSPADLLLYEGLDARVIAVTQTLDSINGVLAQKASALELQQTLLRLTSAESTLDALSGQIALRVTRAEYEADQSALVSRLSSAELTLNALDVPSIQATVQAASNTVKDAEKQAAALLQDILTGEKNRTDAADGLAFARSELSASIQEGLQAEAQQRTQLATQFGQQMSSAEQSLSSLSAADAAEAAARLALAARLDQADSTLQASLSDESQARADADGALSSRITTAQATANNAIADVQTEQSARATETGHLGAQYTVRMQLAKDGQQVVGGFGLSGTSSDTAGARIDFGVLANSFWVAAPSGSSAANIKPFSVQTTSQTVNGVAVPAGVYMDAAYINNVTALWGRFGTLVADSIQATAISASQLTAGNGVIGGTLRSSNYVAGSSGWRLRPDGVAEFSGVIVRGTVYATAGQVGGININGAGLNSGSYSGYSWPSSGGGFHLGPSGMLLGNYSSGKYLQLTADGNIYAPQFSLVNGQATFGGKLSAAAIDAVQTINIAGNAVTVPVSVGGTSTAGNGGWQTVASASVYLDQPGVLFAASGGYIGYPSGFVYVRVELLIDGILVSAAEGNTSLLSAGMSGSLGVGAGSHTVQLRFYASNRAVIQSPNLFAMGVKR